MAIRATDARANAEDEERAARAANAAAVSALPTDGATAYRLERTGRKIVTANIATNHMVPKRTTVRSPAFMGPGVGAAMKTIAVAAMAVVAPRSRYCATFFKSSRGSSVG